MDTSLKKQQCGPADVGRDVVDAGLMKQPCGYAGMPAPYNPWAAVLVMIYPSRCRTLVWLAEMMI